MSLLCKLWPFLAGGLLGWLLSGWLARRFKFIDPPTETTIEKTIEVEKIVDNPDHVSRITELETNLNNQVQQFKSSGSEVVEKQIDNPLHLKRISDLEAELAAFRESIKIDVAAAKRYGFSLKGDGDFTVIEGIGPKINELILNDKISTFAELARTSTRHIQKILDDAGPNFTLAKPDTWPDQSDLAAHNRWEALKAWQDILDGGIE